MFNRIKKVARPDDVVRRATPIVLAYFLLFIPYSLAKADDTAPKEEVFYYISDHLGGIGVVTDENGNVVERKDYLPYGSDRIQPQSDQQIDPPLDPQPESYGYTGKEQDDETGLYYYGARYYDPEIGRFTAEDPAEGDLSDPQSFNKYSYVLNNPIRYVDPTGEKNWDFQPYIAKAVNFYVGEAFGLYKNSISVLSGGELSGHTKNPNQCVELAKQFSKNQNGISLNNTGNGVDYGNQKALDRSFTINNPGKAGGYEVYNNGGNEMPREDDIISWKNGSAGHVGIISEVTFEDDIGKGYVYSLEQNVTKNQGLFYQPLNRTYDNQGQSEYTVGNRNGLPGYNVEAWARYDTESRLPSAIDILTANQNYTSTPYCPATKPPIKNPKN